MWEMHSIRLYLTHARTRAPTRTHLHNQSYKVYALRDIQSLIKSHLFPSYLENIPYTRTHALDAKGVTKLSYQSSSLLSSSSENTLKLTSLPSIEHLKWINGISLILNDVKSAFLST